MRKNYLVWVGISLIGLGAKAQLNGTYSINPGAPASATNYQTVASAVSDLAAGTRADAGPVNGPGVSGPVVLRLAAGSGPYNEQVIIPAITGASATNTITLTGGPTRETIQFTGTTTAERAVIKLNGADYVILDSLTLVNNDAVYGFGVHMTNDADNNVLSNSSISVLNTSTSSNFAGVCITGTTATTAGNNGDNNLIQNNSISGGYYSISIQGTSTTVFSTNNHVIGNNLRDYYYYGIRHYSQTGGIIRGNTLQERATGSTAGYGMYIYYNDRFLVENNWIQRAGTYGIYLAYGNYQGGASSSRASVVNNFVGGSFLGTTPYGIYGTLNPTNVDFYHNSVSMTSGGGRCIYILSGTGNNVMNNIFSYTNSTAGYALYVTAVTNVNSVNNNLYWAPGSSNFVYIAAAYTPATFVGGGGFNANSLNADPGFENAISDLHITSGVAAWDAGANLGILTDFDGETRPMAPTTGFDIGADEHTPDSISVATIALLSPSSFICPDSFQDVSVVIYNKGTNDVSNFPLTANISGFLTTTLSTTYPFTLASGQMDTISLGTINTWSGGNLDFEVYHSVPNEQKSSDDTLRVSRSINLVPNPPSISGDSLFCAGDSTTLIASGAGTKYWYDANSGGTLLQSGDTLTTGPLSLSTTYWVESRGVATNSLTTTYANNNSCGGGNMFDLHALNEITIDSFYLNLSAGTTNTDVYYKVGSYAGFETNAAAWTLLGSATVVSTGAGTQTHCVVGGLTIPAGQTYAIYIYNPNVVYTTLTSTTTYSNADMDITCGVGLCSLFGGLNNPRGWNGTVHYTAEGCPSGRTPAPVTVVPYPVVSVADTGACSSVVLDAGNPGASFLWSNGDSTQTTTASASGPYWVTVSQNGCESADSAQVTIFTPPTPVLGADTAICQGTSLLLDPGTGATFLWSTGDTTNTLITGGPGTYSVEVWDSNGCSGTDTLVLGELLAPSGSFVVDTAGCPSITFDATYSGSGTLNYFWDFGDGNTSTNEDPTHDYTLAGNGTYTVTLIVDNGCGSDSLTGQVFIDCLIARSEDLARGIQVYPNPSSGVFHLENGLAASVTFEVVNLHGQRVAQGSLPAFGREDLRLGTLPAGVYELSLRSGEVAQFRKLVIE